MKKLVLIFAALLSLIEVNAQGGTGYNGGNPNPNANGQGPGNWGNGTGTWGNNGPRVGMPPGQYMQLKRSISMRPHDQGKMIAAKNAVRVNTLSSVQVAGIMRLFASENMRLDFGKYAYNFVGDPENYYAVLDALRYESTIALMEEFIEGSTMVYTGHIEDGHGGHDGLCSHGNVGSGCGMCHPVILPMAHCDFDRLKSSISCLWFESSKEEIAMGSLRNNYFTSAQIRELLFLFTFESTKVNFAKAAYSRVTDPAHYLVIFDAFDFESSKCEISRFINR